MKSIAQGAATTLVAALDPRIEGWYQMESPLKAQR